MRRFVFILVLLAVSVFQTVHASEEIQLAAAIGAAAIETPPPPKKPAPAAAAASGVKPYMIAIGVVSVAVIAAVAGSDSSTSH